MKGMIAPFKMVVQIVNLGMAVMARRNNITGTGFLNLVEFGLPVSTPFFGPSTLERSAAAAATEIMNSLWCHIDKILFSDDFFHDITQIFGTGLPVCFSNKLAGILDGEFHFQFFVPI